MRRAGTMRETMPVKSRGEGPAVVIIPAFGMSPWVYKDTVKVVARRTRVITPDWLALRGLFHPDRAVEVALATLDELGVERFVLIGHSYGGALALAMTAAQPERIRRLLIVGSTGLTGRLKLAEYAIPGSYLYRLATFRSAVGFMRGALRHPLSIAAAGIHGFLSDASGVVDAVSEADLPRHVLWAERDTFIPREAGKRFAERIRASFEVITDPQGEGPTDHDWLWRHPHLLELLLERFGELSAQASGREAGGRTG